MTERFSGIKTLANWLFRSRRTPDVPPATEVEPPEARPAVPVGAGRKRRRARMELYASGREGRENDGSPKNKRKRTKKEQSQERPTPVPVLAEKLENIKPENPNLPKNGEKGKKHKLSVRELIKYAREKGFEVTSENDGHVMITHDDGRKTGFNKRPNTLSPGLYADVVKIIENPKIK